MILPVFEQVKVLVVGDVMLDRYWHGATSRISPEAPVPVVLIEQADARPGGAANVAVNLAHLGAQVFLLGCTGTDEAGEILAQAVTQLGVQSRLLQLKDFATITKLRVVSRHQQLIRLDFENQEKQFTGSGEPALLDRFAELLPQVDLVVLSDYAKGTLVDVTHYVRLAKEAGKTVIIDPKGREFNKYQGATLLTPNAREFEDIVGPCENLQMIEAKGLQLCHQLQLQALLITRGEHGMTLIESGGSVHHLNAYAREVYDVTGAGDTVVATLAAAKAASCSWLEATKLANIAAGLVVAKMGTASVSRQELQHGLWQTLSHPVSGILNQAQLLPVIHSAKAQGESIVFTNGCFDLLHAGHVQYLQAAKQLGDRLIVGVNDDASVARLKGPERPITPLEQRLQVVAALACVDWVVPFSEDTPEQLICSLLPDVLVKGADYQIEQIAGHECVLKNGGKVATLPLKGGCSTSDIVARIRRE